MADRHKTPPLTFRPPADLRAWLAEVSKTTGRAIGAIIIDALREYKERHNADPDTTGR